MSFEIDMDKNEKKRYDRIKESGAYIELNILIGAKLEKYDGHTGKIPVVTSSIHGCGPEEIANMYMTLKQLVKIYEKNYPAECMLGELTMECKYDGTIEFDCDEEE